MALPMVVLMAVAPPLLASTPDEAPVPPLPPPPSLSSAVLSKPLIAARPNVPSATRASAAERLRFEVLVHVLVMIEKTQTPPVVRKLSQNPRARPIQTAPSAVAVI